MWVDVVVLNLVCCGFGGRFSLCLFTCSVV